MSRKKWDGKIPYYPDTGSVPHWSNGEMYVGIWPNRKSIPIPTMDNHVFKDTLHGFKIGRHGRSSVYAEAESEQFPGRGYIIFLTDLEVMMQFMERGKLRGMFTYVKRGSNFGTKLDDEYVYGRSHIVRTHETEI